MELYAKFSIRGKGPGKLHTLHDWLLKQYEKSNPSGTLGFSDKVSETDELIREVRSRCCNKILTIYNYIQLYTLKQIELEQLFVPVFVYQEPSSRRESTQNNPPPEQALQFVKRHQYLTIFGKPGAGKSTFATYLATACCKNESETNWIPVLLRLSEVDTRTSFKLVDELGVAFGTETDITQQIFKSGNVFLILDGLDEVSSQFRKDICQEISNFLKSPHANKIVITCRTNIKDHTLPSVFEQVEIADFDEIQRNQFIENWFNVADNNPTSWLAMRLRQQLECTSQMLIDQVQQNERLHELAKTPILLSLICLLYVSYGNLPEKRSLFYERGLEILLEDWDRDRDRSINNRVDSPAYKRLDSEDKRKILAELARQTFDQIADTVACEQSKALDIMTTYQNCSLQESLEILEGIAADHGLLFQAARRTWEFSHLTFQEYFVAWWFVQHQDWEALAKKICNPRWREVILLTVGMVPNADELVQQLKQATDQLLANDDELQQFLHWVDEKTRSVNAPYKPAAIRAFYFDRSLSHSLDLSRSLCRSLDRCLSRSLDFALCRSLDRSCSLSLDLDFSLDRSLSLCRSLDRSCSLNFDLDRAIRQAEQSDPELKLKLEDLSQQLPNAQDNWEAGKSWWDENGTAWAAQLQTVMIEHRNIGHDWQLSDAQQETLQHYYAANRLLVDCLNSDCYVSRAVRQEIEDTLLLPIAEIENRRKP